MMAQFASLGGVRIVGGSIAIPSYGMWSGDVTLADVTPVSSNVPLVLGNLTMQGNVFRQSPFAGQGMCRVVAGFGGWRKELAPKQYALAAGVKRSVIIKDAALEVGEKVNVPNDSIVGTGWARERAAASRILRLLAPSWYVDPAGVTQIQAWPTRKVPSAFTVIDQRGGMGKVEIATEDYASWLPGCTFTAPTINGTFTNGGVLYRFDEDGTFRLEVLTSP